MRGWNTNLGGIKVLIFPNNFRAYWQGGVVEPAAVAIITVLGFSVLWLWAAIRARYGLPFHPRPLRGYAILSHLVAGAAEQGRGIHISLGTGGMSTATATATWAGLTMLQAVARQAARYGVPLIVTVADAVLLPLAQNALRRGAPHTPTTAQVRFIAHASTGLSPTAYATGVMDILAHAQIAANIMLGDFE